MKKETKTVGLGLLDVLLVIFVVLKLLKVITWSWWLVLMPLWIGIGLLILVILCAIIVAAIDNMRY
jgi:hypothetical protein